MAKLNPGTPKPNKAKEHVAAAAATPKQKRLVKPPKSGRYSRSEGPGPGPARRHNGA